MLKIDIGGGYKPVEGHVNVDMHFGEYCGIDFEQDALPFADDSVDAVVCAHTLEHVDPYQNLLWEITRVCRVGAAVRIAVPHWGHPMAKVAGHKHVLCERAVSHWREFADVWWGPSRKWLSEPTTHYVADSVVMFDARRAFPALSDQQLFNFVPGTCHEIVFQFLVVERPR